MYSGSCLSFAQIMCDQSCFVIDYLALKLKGIRLNYR